MTSKPASRRARATTLAPRSWPSRPGLATRMRTLRALFSGAAAWDMGGLYRPQTAPCQIRLDLGFFEPLRVLLRAVELRAHLEALVLAVLREVLGLVEQRRHLRGLERLEREGRRDRLIEHAHRLAAGDDDR